MQKSHTEQQQQFKVLHRDKYMPLKETAALLNTQLRQALQVWKQDLHPDNMFGMTSHWWILSHRPWINARGYVQMTRELRKNFTLCVIVLHSMLQECQKLKQGAEEASELRAALQDAQMHSKRDMLKSQALTEELEHMEQELEVGFTPMLCSSAPWLRSEAFSMITKCPGNRQQAWRGQADTHA